MSKGSRVLIENDYLKIRLLHNSIKQKSITQQNAHGYIEYLLANYCMPTLLKMKPSSLFRVNVSTIDNIPNFLSSLEMELTPFGSEYVLLYVNDQILLVLIYNKELLENVITDQNTIDFLLTLGYQPYDMNINDLVKRLKDRYHNYIEQKQYGYSINDVNGNHEENLLMKQVGFPHEIGIILGYPIKDVEAFIRNKGRNYLICGYWKVYYDVISAQQIFEKYTTARKRAIQMIYSGKPLKDFLEYNTQGKYCD